MKLKLFTSIILITICLLSAIAIVGCEADYDSGDETVTVTDMAGDVRTIKKNPDKVVCSRSTYDLLVAFGLADKIDGVDKKVLNNPWTAVFYPDSVKHHKYEYEDSYETYLARGVDLVFCPEKRIADELNARGINAITVNLYGTPTFDHQLTFFSELITKIWDDKAVKAKSDEWNEKIRKAVNEIQSTLSEQNVEREKLFYVRGDKDNGIGYTDTKGSFAEYAYRVLGFDSMCAVLETNGNRPSAESICEFDPDVFVMGGIYQNKHVEDVKTTEPYTSLDAVRNNRIYTIPMGLTQMEQLNALSPEFFYDQANRLHPSLFEYDVRKMLKESVKEYFGTDLSNDQIDYMLSGLSPDGGNLY